MTAECARLLSPPPLMQTINAVSGADGRLPWVVLVNGGSVRASIPAGPITPQQVAELVPFSNW